MSLIYCIAPAELRYSARSPRISRAQTIVLRTEKVDIHGRYIADVFLSPLPTKPSDCYQTGAHLNALIANAGHAKIIA